MTSGSAPARANATDDPVDHAAAEQRVQVFGVAERIRVPSPAAMTTAASGSWSSSSHRWLGRQDSNLGSRDQTRCLTTWLRPIVSSSLSAAIGEQQDQGDHRDEGDRDQGERADDDREDRYEGDERL